MDAGVSHGVPARRIEEVGLNAMQTQRQYFYDGWLLRVSPGKAKRGRSVNAFFGSTLPLPAKIDYCAALYQRLDLPLLFRITPFDQPAELEATLAARGFVRFDETLVQLVALDRPPELPAAGSDVEVCAPGVEDFVEAAGELRASPALQRAAHRERLANSPHPRRCVVVRVGERIVCTATIALEDGFAGVFDVVTAPHARGQGLATLACASLLSWAWEHGAHHAYLQVDAGNAPALAVYRKFGFATAYTYAYRGRPDDER